MGLFKDFERGIKDLRGKDVPESPLRSHTELKSMLQSLANYLEEKALELLKVALEKMWPAAEKFGLTREQFDGLVKVSTDAIINPEGEEEE